ncbi:MAG: hypothetical protein Q9200_007202 [Gallowayella weberi]
MPKLENTGAFRLQPWSITNEAFLSAMPPAELESFLQNWLFFGLLNEVLGDLYHHQEYVITSLDGDVKKFVITTADLLSRLEEWEVRIQQDKSSSMDVYKHIAQCLNLTYACLNVKYAAFDEPLRFHLASVAELLGYAASKACDVAWRDNPSRSLIPLTWVAPLSERFQKTVFLEWSHFCPSQMQMLSEEFGEPQALAFVAACFHEEADQSHHACQAGSTCRAGDSIASGQVTRHVTDSCECKFLHVDPEELVRCLESGSLPLLRIKDEANFDRMSIEVVASKDFPTYVALSHVWADGLGNPTATALPRCQVSRLKALIDNLDLKSVDMPIAAGHPDDTPELLLWCDTLCCPVSPEQAKNMALREMYRTYDGATVVLVLDRSLVSPRIGGMHVDEACLRIATSRWMTRLWTLQEGALPARKSRLWFQFTKTAVSVSTLYNHLIEVSRTDIKRRGIMRRLIKRFHTFMSLFDVENSENRGASMEDIRRGLLYRSVTFPSDEPLLIATLMAVDLEPILEAEPAERMNELWRILGTSPYGLNKDILFHMGERTRQRGLRWAPRSLLSPELLLSLESLDSLERQSRGFLASKGKPEGLVVELSGFRVSFTQPMQGLPDHLSGFDSKIRNHLDRHCLILQGSQGRWYLLVHRLFDSWDSPVEADELCTIISGTSSPWILYHGSDSLTPEHGRAYHGLLVEVRDEQQSRTNEVIFVETKVHLAFGHLPTEMNQLLQTAYRLTQELASSAAATRLQSLGTALTETHDPNYEEALESFRQESHRLSRSSFAMEALVASGNVADAQGSEKILEYMERIYRGLYLRIEEYASGSKKWCVD